MWQKSRVIEVIISNQSAIGIFDSGVGGLSVLQAVHDLLPAEDLIYVADTLNTPYGIRSHQFIESRVFTIAEFLIKQDVKAIVVACNTATAAAIKQLRNAYQIPIIGLEPAIKPALEWTQLNSIGVLATQATLESEKYQQLKSQLKSDCEIIEKASHFFVELVESAETIDNETHQKIIHELVGFKGRIDALVLGCTHYPFLTETIQRILGSKIKIFESAYPVAKELKRRIEDQQSKNNIGTVQYYSSAPEQAKTTFDHLMASDISIKLFNG